MTIRYAFGALLLVMASGCGQSSSPTNPTASRSYAISPTAQSVPAGGGTFSATVNSTGACTWTAAADVSWITITSGSAGTKTGAITYSVPANAGVARTGTIAARVGATGAVYAEDINPQAIDYITKRAADEKLPNDRLNPLTFNAV